MRLRIFSFVFAIVLTFIGGNALAAPGDLDTSFGTGGKVLTDFASFYDYAYGVSIQSDGKIVVAGYALNGANEDFAVARYNTDGSLDTSFGPNEDGKVLTDFASGHDGAFSVALQSDGKIVAAGGAWNGTNYDFGLTRYNTDGNLDTSFGALGKVFTNFGFGDDMARSVAIQSDGKIVAAGYAFNGANYDFAVARYNADGSLDTTFNTSGMVTTNFGRTDMADSVALQSDGKIVAAGYAFNGANEDFALARYNADGSPDTTFNTSGMVTTNFGYRNDRAFSVAIQADGKIVAAGYAYNGSNNDFGLARYNAAGSLDTNFGIGGKVFTDFTSGNDRANSVTVQSDGKIVVAGGGFNGANQDFGIVRYDTTGSLDTNFGAGGKVMTDFASGNDGAFGVAIQIDGEIVAAGRAWNGANFDFGLARYFAVTPSEQIANIINYFESVSGGTLTGVGPTAISANSRLNAFGNMLDTAESFIESGSINEACLQLGDAYEKADGNPNPPDFVTGPAAPQMASMVQSLMASLGCQ